MNECLLETFPSLSFVLWPKEIARFCAGWGGGALERRWFFWWPVETVEFLLTYVTHFSVNNMKGMFLPSCRPLLWSSQESKRVRFIFNAFSLTESEILKQSENCYSLIWSNQIFDLIWKREIITWFWILLWLLE